MKRLLMILALVVLCVACEQVDKEYDLETATHESPFGFPNVIISSRGTVDGKEILVVHEKLKDQWYVGVEGFGFVQVLDTPR